jgi:hypothetical protein
MGMMNSAGATNDNAPTYRGLKAAVIILGALILLAFGALVAGLILGGGPRTPARNAPYQVALPAAAGSRIGEARIDGNRLLLRLDGANGSELVVMDAPSGRVIGRVTLTPGQ